MMDILMSETCWAHKKWNKIESDIKLVFRSSTSFFLFSLWIYVYDVVNGIYNTLNIAHCFGRNNFDDGSISKYRSLRGMNNTEYPTLCGSYLHDRSANTHWCFSSDNEFDGKISKQRGDLSVDIIALLRVLSKYILSELASTICVYINLLRTTNVLFRTYCKEDPRIT